MLKQALQPSIDIISIDWRVPSADVSQIPTEVPPVFSGSRVVFGIPRNESGSKGEQVECNALLRYRQGTEKKSLLVHFTLPPLESQKGQVGGDVDAYPIHRLAGKQLLQEVAKKNDKEELVRVSLETGVVCKETAFVADMEDGEEVMTGALRRQTVSVPMRSMQLSSPFQGMDGASFASLSALTTLQSMAQAMTAELAAQSETLDMVDVRCNSLSVDAHVQQRTVQHQQAASFQKRRRGNFFRGIGSAISRVGSAMSRRKKPNRSSDSATSADVNMPPVQQHSSLDDTPNFEEDSPEIVNGPSPMSAAITMAADHLAIVSLQQFSGAWNLNEAFAKICGRSLSDLHSSLPASLSSLSDKDSVWATLLAVAILKHRHSSVEDEWELCVEKAMLWLKSCLESTSQSVEALLAIATSLL